MVIREENTYYNWLIYNKVEGTFVWFRGTAQKAYDLFNHLNALSMGKTNLYRNGELIK